MNTVSPLAPTEWPSLPPIAGLRLGAVAAGLRYRGRPDVLVAELPEGSTLGLVTTTSRCPSAPVEWCRALAARGVAPRGLVCNAGNANAFTGAAGVATVETSVRAVGQLLGVEPTTVLTASTGVIGEPMDDGAFARAIGSVLMEDCSQEAWRAAADAIRTTDTFAKAATAAVGDGPATVVGIAKGSGMISPDLATMLAFVFTDAAVPGERLQSLTASSAARSFNRISVDSDTSTSDTVAVMATGVHPVDDDALGTALAQVMTALAHQIVRDGEGATKFVSVEVTGAESDTAAERIARSIADSPLVKTAIAAEDANWGRIVMAVGKAGERADRDALRIRIGDELVAANGAVVAGYSEANATAHLQNPEIRIAVDVGVGEGSATVWTCDLTHGYIDINAGYRS